MGITLIPYSALSGEKKQAAMTMSPDGFYLERGDGKEIIYYDDQKGYERCNMTILHEIGHAVLGHTESTNPEIAESEAAFFAKYAASPPPLVHTIKPECPEEIADAFCISYEASVYSLIYYHKWLYKYRQRGRYSIYETKLLDLFKRTAQEAM